MEDFEVYEEHNEEDVKQNSFNEKSENTETSLTIQTCCAIMKRDFLKRNECRLYYAINIR